MSYHLLITNVAERDISQAADYIEFILKNPKAADNLDQKINALLSLPQEHPIVEDNLLATWGIRFTQIKNYLAFYVIEENQATVVRFLYGKSNWISILQAGYLLRLCISDISVLSAFPFISVAFFVDVLSRPTLQPVSGILASALPIFLKNERIIGFFGFSSRFSWVMIPCLEARLVFSTYIHLFQSQILLHIELHICKKFVFEVFRQV